MTPHILSASSTKMKYIAENSGNTASLRSYKAVLEYRTQCLLFRIRFVSANAKARKPLSDHHAIEATKLHVRLGHARYFGKIGAVRYGRNLKG